MHRKLTSEAFKTFLRTRIAIGTAEIKATSFRETDARTPTCHSLVQPGARSALKRLVSFQERKSTSKPFEELLGVIESEHSLIILDIMPIE